MVLMLRIMVMPYINDVGVMSEKTSPLYVAAPSISSSPHYFGVSLTSYPVTPEHQIRDADDTQDCGYEDTEDGIDGALSQQNAPCYRHVLNVEESSSLKHLK